jgi:hypothetical protein
VTALRHRRAVLLLAGLAVAAPAAAQEALLGRWVGGYVCGQGETGLVLQVDRLPEGGAAALFHFWPPPGNPAAAEGCFEMRAEAGKGDPGALSLRAGRWLLRPEGYLTVDLHGRIDASGTRFEGSVDGPGCGGFVLRRGGDAPRLPPSCRPATGKGASASGR